MAHQPGTELCHTSFGLSYEAALVFSLQALIGCGLWLCAVGARVPPGRWRLVAAVHVVLVNAALPKLFCRWEDSTTIVLMSFNVMWLSSFKALSWAVNRGALCTQPFTPAQFVATYIFPITPVVSDRGADAPAAPAAPAGSTSSTVAADAADAISSTDAAPAAGTSAAATTAVSGTSDAVTAAPVELGQRGSKGRLGEDAGGTAKMVAAWLAKNAFIAFLVWLLQHPLPAMLESFVNGLALYALLSFIMDGPAALVIGLTGLHVSPHFDHPWQSTSVATFWSKRWDLAAGNTLRQLVFDCVMDGSLLPPPPGTSHKRPSASRQSLGSLASFATSGMVHEGIFWYLTGHTTRGIWLSFFLVQAPIIVAERLVLGALQWRGVLLPTWLRIGTTMLLVVATAQHLFWAPCKKYGVTDSVVGNVQRGILALLQGTGLLVAGSGRSATA